MDRHLDDGRSRTPLIQHPHPRLGNQAPNELALVLPFPVLILMGCQWEGGHDG